MYEAEKLGGFAFGDERAAFGFGTRQRRGDEPMLEAENIAIGMPRQVRDRCKARRLGEHEVAILGGRAADADGVHASATAVAFSISMHHALSPIGDR